ncbi:hypothetical protein NIES1031_19700 [Chroogloeocystis siderophila 5.2 s.c.1]|jgi:hypothetical protein|uniref:Uncharacterized protein n=1 Tax=Chroogloeocystis siderophila 5.2 s.c.1 TaxID=247279 RepID=A0A1U7HGI8_9CHRO|nr:hypothetical protein [Chroogloeocystis siderophila]OKH22679.1 hypothetical protein NIES1031_19700 [Chroogloeocystis siderophila 5.2 s.c.1]
MCAVKRYTFFVKAWAIAEDEKTTFFVPCRSYLQKVEALFEEHRKKILHLVPTAHVEHIEATSILVLLTKGDLD